MTMSAPSANWAGNIAFRARRLHRPGSIGELQQIVGSAEKVRALGTGHCFNHIADSTGDLVSLAALPQTVEIDAERATVTVAAGLRYAKIAEPLQAAGFALANLASLPDITVAGACATGTHGSGSANAGLASAVSALQLIGPDGELSEIRRDTDPDRLPGAVVSLGALGIVASMTLDIEPTFDVRQYVHVDLPLDRLAEEFESVFAAAYSVSVFTDWRSGKGEAWLKLRTDRGDCAAPDLRALGGTLADGARHPVPGRPATDCTEQLGVPGPWHLRLPHFRPGTTPDSGDELQSEFFLPRDAAAEAFAALRGLGDQMAPVLMTSEIRTIAADALWLSPSHGRESVAFHFTWIKDPAAVAVVVAAIEERLMPLGARPHWGKVFTTPLVAVASLYERAADFRRLMLDLDPAGKFRNAYLDDLLLG